MSGIEIILLFVLIFLAVLILPKYVKGYLNKCVETAYNDPGAQQFLKRRKIGDIRKKEGNKDE